MGSFKIKRSSEWLSKVRDAVLQELVLMDVLKEGQNLNVHWTEIFDFGPDDPYRFCVAVKLHNPSTIFMIYINPVELDKPDRDSWSRQLEHGEAGIGSVRVRTRDGVNHRLYATATKEGIRLHR